MITSGSTAHAVKRLGVPGWLGLLLLLTVAWLQLYELPRLQRQKLTATLAVQVQVQQLASALRSERGQDNASHWRLLRGQLPELNNQSTLLANMLETARTQGLQPQGLQVSAQDVAAVPCLQSLQISLPVRASYASLRAWMEQSLANQPGLALDGLSLRRNDLNADEFDAQLSFTSVAVQETCEAEGRRRTSLPSINPFDFVRIASMQYVREHS